MHYRTKPGVVQAWRIERGEITPTWLDHARICQTDGAASVYDKLHDTWIKCKEGDWIIKGTEGELYPCVDEVFQKKYEQI